MLLSLVTVFETQKLPENGALKRRGLDRLHACRLSLYLERNVS